ncbi:hypothetical protein HNY73_004713 [Argiope bruennichi]|uniref:Uncharacterized protein n=1 Tax=Argiope bruennichi TaxID=94029 RepID=A0A8T0FU62_ARGBR|nr:hypothetical protein HNY73_004713 [Argiope bruennichi]
MSLECDSENPPEVGAIHPFPILALKAYGAVLIFKTENSLTKFCVYLLLASKCACGSLLKPLALPRLEVIMGELLAGEIGKKVSRVLSEKISATNHFLDDSTTKNNALEFWIQVPAADGNLCRQPCEGNTIP